jgi:orotate phosphoribosyltransferase
VIDWLDRLRARGAVLEGHFRLTSGFHSPVYIQCARLLQHPTEAAAAATSLVERLAPRLSGPPDLVVSPAIGGIVFGHEVARAWGCRANWAERDPTTGRLTFRRGFAIEPGERVVAVEDVVTTAGSLRELVALVAEAGAQTVGVGAIVDRSGGEASWEVPWAALVTIDATRHPSETCPQCARGIPLDKPGSRPT